MWWWISEMTRLKTIFANVKKLLKCAPPHKKIVWETKECKVALLYKVDQWEPSEVFSNFAVFEMGGKSMADQCGPYPRGMGLSILIPRMNSVLEIMLRPNPDKCKETATFVLIALSLRPRSPSHILRTKGAMGQRSPAPWRVHGPGCSIVLLHQILSI